MKEKQRIRRLNIKQTVLTHYGNEKCACVECGFSDIRALSIDHIKNDGAKHRKSGILKIYNWLVENDYPEGYQTLCMNCQWIKKYNNQKVRLPLKHQNNLTKRIRHWLSMRDSAFNTNDVMAGLGLEKEKRGKVRVILARLCKEGIIHRRTYADGGIIAGYFNVILKRTEVFG